MRKNHVNKSKLTYSFNDTFPNEKNVREGMDPPYFSNDSRDNFQ